jgi:hypothetical protein
MMAVRAGRASRTGNLGRNDARRTKMVDCTERLTGFSGRVRIQISLFSASS